MYPHLHDSKSLDWDAKQFIEFIDKVAEGPRFDRKFMIKVIDYKLSTLEALLKESLHDADKAKQFEAARKSLRDFIIDCIAMANTARRHGASGYIVFGVADDWIPNPDGILWQATRNIPRPEYEKHLRSPGAFAKLQMDLIARDFTKYICQFIEPWPDFRYEFGWAEYKSTVYAFGYLVFYESRTPLPYRPKILKDGDEESKKWHDLLAWNSGVTWSRIGESNTIFEGEQINTLHVHSNIPFVPRERWLNYVNNLQELLLNFQRLDPILSKERIGLQTIYATDSISRVELNLFNELEQFAYSDISNQLLLVIGHGGTGKSTALRYLLLQLTDKLQASLYTNKKREQPQEIIPIYVEFNHNIGLASVQHVVNRVTVALSKLHLNDHENLDKILQDRMLKFLIILDAVDEINIGNRSESLQSIWNFVEKYPNVKIILASRPHVFPDYELSNRRCLELRMLSINQIENIVASSNLSTDIQFHLINLIKSDEELYKLFSKPSILRICTEELTGVEQVSLGLILEKSIDRFLERDFAKLDENSRRDYYIELCDMTEQTLLSPSFPITRTRGMESYAHWISNGLLQRKDRHLVTFVSDYIPTYLLAKLIQTDMLFQQKNRHYIDNNPNQYQNIIRILANLYELDISDSNLMLCHWVKNLNDPYLTLRVYVERQHAIVHDLSIFQKALTDLLAAVTPDSLFNTRYVISNLVSHVRNQELIETLMTTLLQLDNNTTKLLLNSDEIVKFINQYVYLNLQITLCALQLMDWSLDYPDNLIDVFRTDINYQVHEIALQKMLNNFLPVPSRLLNSINQLSQANEESVAMLAKALLNRTMDEVAKLRRDELRRKQLAEEVMATLNKQSLVSEEIRSE